MSERIYVTGDTYPIKDQLKQLGCRWDTERRCWYTQDATVAEQAKALLTPVALYNSPPPVDLGTTDPVSLAAAFGRKAVAGAKVESRDVYGLAKGDNGEPNGTVHLIRRKQAVRILQVARTARRYLSAEWLEDCDLFDVVAGGSYQWDGVEVEPTAAEAATDAMEAAMKADALRIVEEAKAKAAADQEARSQAWDVAKAGLFQSTASPAGTTDLNESLTIGEGSFARKIQLADGRTGWRHEITGGDDWRTYFYLPADVANAACLTLALQRGITAEEAEAWLGKYKGCHGEEVYKAVVEADEPTKEALRQAKEALQQAKYRDTEKEWRRSIETAVKPGDWQGSRGCAAWEALHALGVDPEIVVDPAAFTTFCRAYADSGLYSKERDALKLEIVLKARLPESVLNKDGAIKKAFERKLPAEGEAKQTGNRFLWVRVEYTR